MKQNREKGSKFMIALVKDVYEVARTSKNEEELIDIIRAIVPGTLEAGCILWYLERNSAYNATLRLEVACKLTKKYRSFEIVDDIIECAANTSLMKRLYEADVNKYGAFVAVNITDPFEIEEMYNSGIYEIQCATAGNPHATMAFLEKVIRETGDARIKSKAQETLNILTAKSTTDPDTIESMYRSGTYEEKLVAVSNIHIRSSFLEEIVFDDAQPQDIRECALKTFEKISST